MKLDYAFVITSLLIFLSLPGAVFSQDEGTVPVKIYLSQTGVAAGGEAALAVIFETPEFHHITSVDLGLFYVEVKPVEGFTFQPPEFPQPVDFAGDKVYKGKVPVKVKFRLAPEVKPGDYKLTIAYGYQICIETGNKMCYLPQIEEKEFTVTVLEKRTTPIPANTEIFGSTVENTPVINSEVPAKERTLETRFTSALEQGSVLAFFLVFIAGILTSFTPCVYPVIPITIGYIGGRSEGKKFKGFLLSIFLTLGIALVYSTLGIIAAATGSVFGAFTQKPGVIIGIAVIFAAMGASMLGAFELQLPASMQSKMRTEKKGYAGAFLVGMITGLVAAPCVGPVLVALLAWVAQTGNILLGFFLLFTFAIGMGLLFIVIGTFAGAMTALPGAGQWMDTVKHVFGVILIGAAIFIMRSLMPEGFYYLIWGVFLILTGVFSGALEILSSEAGGSRKLGKGLGVVLLILGIVMFVDGYRYTFGFKSALVMAAGGTASTVEGVEWIVNNPDKAFAEAKSQGANLIMDFYADWCAACVELEEKTWVDKDFIAASQGWIFLKIDLTKVTPELSALQTKYEVRGMPTVIFFDKDGMEKLRFAGFRNAEEVIGMMKGKF